MFEVNLVGFFTILTIIFTLTNAFQLIFAQLITSSAIVADITRTTFHESYFQNKKVKQSSHSRYNFSRQTFIDLGTVGSFK